MSHASAPVPPRHSAPNPERRFRAIIEHAWDVFAIFDADFRVLYLSPSVERVFGYGAEIVGLDGFAFVDPDDRPEFARLLALAVATPGTPQRCTHRFRRRDGEIRVLETVMTSMLDDAEVGGIVIHSLDVTEYDRLEARLLQSQLALLRAQIHPHFLLNALATVQELITIDPERADDMIAALGELLRLSFRHAGLATLALRDELAFVTGYLAVQQLRYPDVLAVSLDVAEETLGAVVPNMLLQPLVENAVRHGLGARSGRGTVKVTSRRRGDMLRVEIEDDGVGLAPSAVTGLGTGAAAARLARLYGSRQRFELLSTTGGGVCVLIELPFQHASVADAGADRPPASP